jgi:hypothetical protein
MYYELTPAYGRDYRTSKEVKAAFQAGKDFQGDYQLGYGYVNKPQLPLGAKVVLRFKGNTMTALDKVTTHDLIPESVKPAAKKQPSMATLSRWMMDGVAKATDGCEVEPDGTCEHGKPSWLLAMGLI